MRKLKPGGICCAAQFGASTLLRTTETLVIQASGHSLEHVRPILCSVLSICIFDILVRVSGYHSIVIAACNFESKPKRKKYFCFDFLQFLISLAPHHVSEIICPRKFICSFDPFCMTIELISSLISNFGLIYFDWCRSRFSFQRVAIIVRRHFVTVSQHGRLIDKPLDVVSLNKIIL